MLEFRILCEQAQCAELTFLVVFIVLLCIQVATTDVPPICLPPTFPPKVKQNRYVSLAILIFTGEIEDCHGN